MATASEVPGVYDVVLDGKGYVFLDSIESSLPFRTHRATYALSPTFIDRSNVSGNFGDNQQDFWLTATQKDWSLGEQQKYYRGTTEDGQRRYWKGTKVDVSIPGQVSMRYEKTTVGPGAFGSAAMSAVVTVPATSVAAAKVDTFYGADNTNLWNANTSKGAHGLGANPTTLVCDSTDLYMSTESAGTVGVRKYDVATSTFSTFSATAVSRLAFLNNTLYGLKVAAGSTTELGRFDTAGAYSTLFTWKAADGGTLGFGSGQLCPYGGKLAVLLEGGDGAELWFYDGVGTSIAAKFPANLVGSNVVGTTSEVSMGLQVAQGILFVSGGISVQQDTVSQKASWKPSIWFYVGGTIGELWRASNSINGRSVNIPPDAPLIAPYQNGLAFVDDDTGQILFYNTTTGGFSSIATPSDTSHANSRFFGNMKTKLLYVTRDTYDVLPDTVAGIASSSTVTTSLFDFETSLTKVFRGIRVEFDSATNGDGGTVDIAYRVNDPDSTYTTLQTGVTSGSEYTLTNITGKRISVKVTLNKGTSTLGPVLKRVSVRAAPLLLQFRKREFILDCAGDGMGTARELRDGTPDPRSGREQVNDLITLSQASTAFSVTDRFGTYTGLVDLSDQEGFEIYETHPALENPAQSGTYVVRVKVREV